VKEMPKLLISNLIILLFENENTRGIPLRVFRRQERRKQEKRYRKYKMRRRNRKYIKIEIK
jgi:hypothetical protein